VTRARWLLSAAVAAVGFPANAQITFEPYNVTTFAGVPTRSGSFDGGGAPAYFGGNNGVAVDGSGTIYVADSGRHVIRKVTANGAITTFARGVDQPGSADGTAKVARFRDPAHLTVDADRNFYVVDPGESYDPED
jgi:hypothetical protein